MWIRNAHKHTQKWMCDVQNDDEKNNENERVMMKKEKKKNLQK